MQQVIDNHWKLDPDHSYHYIATEKQSPLKAKAATQKCDIDVERIAALILSGDKAAAQADFDAVCKCEKFLDYHAVMMRDKIFKIVNEKKNAAPKNAAPTVSASTKQAIKMTKTQWLAIGRQAQWDKRLAQSRIAETSLPSKTAQSAPRPDPFANWKKELTAKIAQKIEELKADGTTAMSLENLMMVVRPPQGGPSGTNAQYYYRNDWFPNAVKALPLKYRSFILASANVKVLNLKLSQINPKHKLGHPTHVSCDQCQAIVIQGKPCHESGCPNSHIDLITGQPYPVPCFQCGCDYVPEGKVHRTKATCPDCANPEPIEEEAPTATFGEAAARRREDAASSGWLKGIREERQRQK